MKVLRPMMGVIFLIVFLCACVRGNDPTPAQPVIMPVNTNSPVPTPTSILDTKTSPAPTLIPFSTHAASPTATKVGKPVDQTASPNPNVIVDESPDDKWVVRTIDWEEIEVAETEGLRRWSLIYAGEYSATYMPFHWSKDGKYLFFQLYRSMDGDYGGFYDGSGAGRLDLETGELTEIISDCGLCFMAFTVSPDDHYLIWIEQNDSPESSTLPIWFLNLETGYSFRRFLGDYFSGGAFVWSPEGDELLIMVVTEKAEREYEYTVLRQNMQTLEFDPVISGLDVGLRDGEWLDNNLVEYRDWASNIWVLNLNSRDLVLRTTATPVTAR